jgi:hypothetical protein
MNISVGDLVIFKYERKDPEAKIGLVLKKEIRAMPQYTAINPFNCDGPFPSSVNPIMQEVLSCYCLWTSKKKRSRRWWAPITSLTLVERGRGGTSDA